MNIFRGHFCFFCLPLILLLLGLHKNLFEQIRNMTLCVSKGQDGTIIKLLGHFTLLPLLLLITCGPFASATDYALTLYSCTCLFILFSFLSCGQYIGSYTWTMHVSTHKHTNLTKIPYRGRSELPSEALTQQRLWQLSAHPHWDFSSLELSR